MSLLASVLAADPARTHHWLLPETDEIIYGGLASVLIFAALWKFAGPAVKKAMAGRTAKIQAELDASAAAKSEAQTAAAGIRQAAGDIASERSRLLAEADTQAATLLDEGRARLATDAAEIETRAEADIVSAGGRVNDELRGEIARLAGAATDRVLADGAIDAATQQELIEAFIQKVGAS